MITHDNMVTALKTCQAINLINEHEVKSTIEIIKQGTSQNFHKNNDSKSVSGITGEEFRKYIGDYQKVDDAQVRNSYYINDNSSHSETPNLNERTVSIATYNKGKGPDYIIGNTSKLSKLISHVKLIACATTEDKKLLLNGIKQISPEKNIIGITYGVYDLDCVGHCDVTFSSNDNNFDILSIDENKSNNYSMNLSNAKGDIILLNHSLSTMIASIIHARNIYDSIRKFIQYQLTICIITVTFATLGNFYFIDTPLSPVQMLWINIIMDSLGALALATEDPDEEMLLSYGPYNGKLFNSTMYCNIICQVIYQFLVLMTLLFYGHLIIGVPSDKMLHHHEWNMTNGYHITFIFNTFITMQIFNMINCRKVHAKEKNCFRGI